jgi:hypothetical protein
MRTQTSGVLKVSLDDLGLRIASRDFRSIEGAELEPGTPAGRALDRVARVSDRCGITPLSDGEILWAVLTNRVAQ